MAKYGWKVKVVMEPPSSWNFRLLLLSVLLVQFDA